MSINNCCRFLGRIGKDPEVISWATDKQMVKLSLAVSDNYKDKSGEWQEKTTWINLTCFRPGLVNLIEKYYQKGNMVIVEAQYQMREYEKDGEKKYSHEFIIQEIRNPTTAGNKAKENNPEKEDDSMPF
jgi:single-strand DNA-binding protein